MKIEIQFSSSVQVADVREISMPCCGHQLQWLGSRDPNYCPECGKILLRRDKFSTLANGEALLCFRVSAEVSEKLIRVENEPVIESCFICEKPLLSGEKAIYSMAADRSAHSECIYKAFGGGNAKT